MLEIEQDRINLDRPVKRLRPPRTPYGQVISISTKHVGLPRGWRVFDRFLFIHHPEREVCVWNPRNGRHFWVSNGRRGAQGPFYVWSGHRVTGRAPWIDALPWAPTACELTQSGYVLSVCLFLERGEPTVSYDARRDVFLPEPHWADWESAVTEYTWIFKRDQWPRQKTVQ